MCSIYLTKKISQYEQASIGCYIGKIKEKFALVCSKSLALLLTNDFYAFVMYAAFNWAYEAEGASGFIEYASNPRKSANVVEVANSPRPNAIPKTPSTIYMTPKMYPGDGADMNFNKHTSIQPRVYRDVGVSTDLGSPVRPRIRGDFGSSKISPLQAKCWNKGRSMSTENGLAPSGFGRRDGGLDKDDCKYIGDRDIVA